MIVIARFDARCADCGTESDVPCAEPCLSRSATAPPAVPRPRAASMGRHHVRGDEVVFGDVQTAPTPGSGFPTTASVWLGESDGLSVHEGAIVALIVLGLSNQEIARALHKSLHSIRTYIRTAYRKMGVTNRPQAIEWGNLHGFRLRTPPARPDESGPQ